MKFKKLADLFSELESTTKRLEMTDILSTFFENLKEEGNLDDLEKCVYLLQGQLVSNIKQFPKMGIAEKTIIEALSVHSGVNKEKIRQVLIKKGDLGATAELIFSKKKKQTSLADFGKPQGIDYDTLEISELYSTLERIALTEGSGSHDTKLRILRDLMRISPIEVKYLLRIITSTLRVGVSTQTIIDGLALGFTGDKTNRDIIENAFNLHPDLGDISRILANKGIENVAKVEIMHGVPIRMMLASRVPYAEIIGKLGAPFIAEYKLDGERLQIHKKGDEVVLFSRQLIQISEQYPDVCDLIKSNINAESVVLEGEVVAMDAVYEKMLPFQVLSKRRRKHDVENVAKEIPVCLFIFDILKCDDEVFMNHPLPIRRAKLEEIVEERDEMRLVKSVTINSTDELVEFFHEARDGGTEGVMTKSIKEDSFYQAGNRGYLWIKLKGLEGGKLLDSIDVVIIGAFYGKGRRKGMYGTYLGAVYDEDKNKFEAFTRVGTGFSDDVLEELLKEMKQYEIPKRPSNILCEDTPDIWFKPHVVIEVIGDEITKSEKFSSLGFSLRFPVFQRIRIEKGVKDISTVDEIKKLYETQ